MASASKTCSVCGHKLSELPLSVREWECPVCHTKHDRDINASQNIKNEAIKMLLAGGYTATACGDLCKTQMEQQSVKQEGNLCL